jgi:hypothetical protein
VRITGAQRLSIAGVFEDTELSDMSCLAEQNLESGKVSRRCTTVLSRMAAWVTTRDQQDLRMKKSTCIHED